MSDDRQAYLRRRAQEARESAAAAVDERARGIHLKMAIRYELLADGGGEAPPVDEDDAD